MKAKEITFTNDEGVELQGMIELPVAQKAQHFALFAHCFTCNKDLRSVRKIALALNQRGLGVLRFDFSGLGDSGGDFSETNFSSNVKDLHAAYNYLCEHYQEPDLLIGHSLGGTSALMAASQLPGIEAVATIGAPCDPDHVLNMLEENLDTIEKEGQASVVLAGRKFVIKKQFIDDLRSTGIQAALDQLKSKSLLFLHSPQDKTVGVENARHLYEMAHHPKSFVSLDGADHLLSRARDAQYAGEVIASWASRYLPENTPKERLHTKEQVVAELEEGPFLTRMKAGKHLFLADEPQKVGGEDLGPSPYELVTSGLGACTAMTLKMYADRKKWPLEEVRVHLSYDGKYVEDCDSCDKEDRRLGKFLRRIEIEGPLDEKQRQRLLEIANKCPVHRTLERTATIETELLPGD